MAEPGVQPQGRFDPHEFANAATIISWLESQPDEKKLEIVQEAFSELLQDAAQPRKSSSQACVKLCGFVQLCTRSLHDGVRAWAFREETSARLFEFYIEWNEHDQHRSMRLVLDVLTIAFLRNPDPAVGRKIKESIMQELVNIISRLSTRPLVKSSLHCLVHFLSKQAISLNDIIEMYQRDQVKLWESTKMEMWRSLVSVMFSWTDMHYVCPIAGKFIVNILTGLMSMAQDGLHPYLAEFGVQTWQEWIQEGLGENMDRLESVKNYIITPLFAADRKSALELLKIYNQQSSDDALLGKWALLKLSILEVGKKAGMVDEPGNVEVAGEKSATVALQSSVLESFLVHPTHVVRSSGLSLLVSSSSTTKPLSEETFRLIREHLASYYADQEAKFRNDILSFTKDLINRVKYVMAMATRSLGKAEAKPQQQEIPAKKPKLEEKKRKKGTENIITDEKEAREVLDRHTAFLNWYIEFCKGELVPTASYQRHIAGLKALLPVLKLGKHNSGSDETLDLEIASAVFTDSTSIRLLVDMLMDPFDDVRETALSILLLIPQDFISKPLGESNGTLLDALTQFCTRAAQLASTTGRADHGNGAARAQGLLCSWLGTKEKRVALVSEKLTKIWGKLAKARVDLGRAAMEDSVHGDFAALGYIWPILTKADVFQGDEDRAVFVDLYQRIVSCCTEAWDIVRHVLCDDSPEGHLPEEMEDIEGLDTKDLLSYSFRAIHESSNVMRMVVSGVGSWGPESALIPPQEVFDTLGALTFNQLALLRHRGAFTTVSSTFTMCCQMTKLAPATYQSDNLHRWYEAAKQYIEKLASTTRRSAGIPSLIIGVLAANADSPSFSEVFQDLGEIAKRPATTKETDGSNLPQVHALNCLRGIFRTSLLSKRAESYLPATLELAANSLKSEIWAIRNCGLLLLRSLIDCLFGTGESKHVTESGWDGHTIRISYNKYPTLPAVLLSLLKSAGPSDLTPGLSSTGAAEAVFPVLDIIRRAGPPDDHRQELYNLIKQYLDSQLWHVREIAARTLCSFILGFGRDWIRVLHKLIFHECTTKEEETANRFHGALLTAKFVLERKIETDVEGLLHDVPEFVRTLGTGAIIYHPQIYDQWLKRDQPHCEDALATYYEINNLLLKIGPQGFDVDPSFCRTNTFTEEDEDGYEDEELNLYTGDKNEKNTASALLRLQRGLMVVYSSARCHKDYAVKALTVRLITTFHAKDLDTALKMLEVLPEVWGPIAAKSRDTRSYLLAQMAAIASGRRTSPEVRSAALVFYKQMLDVELQLHATECSLLKDKMGDAQKAWESFQIGEMNPRLSDAVMEFSGSFAAMVSLMALEGWGTRLKAWGNMVADGLDINNTFDTRLAAANALESYFAAASKLSKHPEHLPALIALYDALNDDDDEVRDVATRVAGIVTGETVTTLEASDRLLNWLTIHFGDMPPFKVLVVRRLAGVSDTWTSAEHRLSKALDFDDSLFAEEEQNLFIDEIREAKRFLRVFRKLKVEGDENVYAYQSLVGWASKGLETLVRVAGEREDGPMGWTSDQHVFAVCSDVILAGVALREDPVCDVLLERLVEVGGRSGLHGALLEMAQGRGDLAG